MAEGLMRKLAGEAGLGEEIEVDSAGTHDYEVGDPPDARAIAAALRRGVDISDLRARQVHPADFEIFDYIVALDRGHRQILRHAAPLKARNRIYLLMDFVPGGQSDVADPYYGPAEGFDPIRDQIERGVRGLLVFLRKEGVIGAPPQGPG
jgi:protein-tyrosine phosphatase